MWGYLKQCFSGEADHAAMSFQALASVLKPLSFCFAVKSLALDSRRVSFSSSANDFHPTEESRQKVGQWCTYGESNKRWLSQELNRILSMEKFPGDGLLLTRGHWTWIIQDALKYKFKGKMIFHNISKRSEIFVPEVKGTLQLMSRFSLDCITSSVKLLPQHPSTHPRSRDDGYWPAYIIRAGEYTTLEVLITIESEIGMEAALSELQAACVAIAYISYGPHGRTSHVQHVVLPLHYPEFDYDSVSWHKGAGSGTVLPVRTHLLSHLDDPLEVLRMYILPHAKAGDVIAIGETPLAIMQGRFRHPQNVKPGVVAKLACRLFHPTSSLATACGMQVLIDISGRVRVILAVFAAIAARLVGIRGMFYCVAGEQARLIDDITGTLPPYDQFITLGPVRVKDTVDALKSKTGYEIAVVDVNDLKRVQILAASDGVDHASLTSALLDNPAGNQDEQTPIVLVRLGQKTINH